MSGGAVMTAARPVFGRSEELIDSLPKRTFMEPAVHDVRVIFDECRCVFEGEITVMAAYALRCPAHDTKVWRVVLVNPDETVREYRARKTARELP
jgi:hypothetical protein